MELLAKLIQDAASAVSGDSPQALLALMMVAALTEMGVPFPFMLDGILFYFGYEFGFDSGMLSARALTILLTLLAGRILGSAAVYWPSRFLGQRFINKVTGRFPSLKPNLDRLKNRIGSGTPLVVAITRLTPGLLMPSTLAGGAMCLNYGHFTLGILLSSLIADGALMSFGLVTALCLRFFGVTPSFWVVGGAFFTFIIMIYLAPNLVRRLRKTNETTLKKGEGEEL